MIRRNKFLFALLFIFALSGCENKEQSAEYLARVNDVYLTKDDVVIRHDTSALSPAEREEILRNWVNEELLFQQAGKKGVLSNPEFSKKVEAAKRQLAISIFLEEYFEDNYSVPDEATLQKYFQENQQVFKLKSDAYVFNIASFNNEELAAAFRERLLNDTWQRAIKTLPKSELVVANFEGRFEYDYELRNFTVKRFLESFNPGETSIIFSSRPGEYSVVQLTAGYKVNEVPPLNVILSQVQMLYKEEQRKAAVKKLVEELYSKNEIEIK